jgi:hypothetical protein
MASRWISLRVMAAPPFRDPLLGGTAHSRRISVSLQAPGSSRPYVTVSKDLSHQPWSVAGGARVYAGCRISRGPRRQPCLRWEGDAVRWLPGKHRRARRGRDREVPQSQPHCRWTARTFQLARPSNLLHVQLLDAAPASRAPASRAPASLSCRTPGSAKLAVLWSRARGMGRLRDRAGSRRVVAGCRRLVSAGAGESAENGT